ncbi:MAG: Amuc_1098 family type IV pilus outer membrane protein [Verrucomicrobiales bacterium]
MILLVGIFVFLTPGVRVAYGDGNEVPGGIVGVAAREAVRRQEQVKAAQTLFTVGSRAFADRSYGEAMDNFKAAFETVPAVPAVEEQRLVFFKRYQAAAYRFAQVLATEARWAEAEQTLEDVIETADDNSLPATLVDPEIREMLEDLASHDDRYNRATTSQHLRNVNAVEGKLILARGYLELGDYDRAERSYNEVLAIDPYSTAARRGLESVERRRLNYYDAAQDHTRAKMLAEVAAGWESPVPTIGLGTAEVDLPTEVAGGGAAAIERKLKSIVIPRVEFNDATLSDVLEFLGQKSQELDSSEQDPAKRGVNIVVSPSAEQEGQNVSGRTLSVRLSNIPLGVALKYVTQQVDMKYRVDDYAVTVIPMSEDANAALVSRSYTVPPGFLSTGAQTGGDTGGVTDPFAEPSESAGALVTRVTARSFLEQNGVVFSPGSLARYNPASSSLVVRNTPQQLETVENLIRSVKENAEKNVKVNVKMISIEQTLLKQSGLDFLLGASNLGSTPRVFFGGGTDGNAAVPVDGADYPFVTPGGSVVGMNPVTSGLRMGNLASGQSIDNVIQGGNPESGSGRSPGVFSVAGVFTDPQFQMVLRALSQMKGEDTLDDTHVVVRPGQIATIEQIREFIYPTEYDPPEIPNDFGGVQIGNTRFIGEESGVFPATPATPTAFEMRPLGSSIEVEPTVSSDNQTVNVNVTLDFTDFVGFINYGTPITNARFSAPDGSPSVVTENEILMPVFDAVKETTNVSVWDGQTIVIGGLHGESVIDGEDKVPYLGDLPVVGRAFRSSTRDTAKRAMLIFVSVSLIDPGGSPINLPEEPDLVTSRDDPPEPSSPVFAPGPMPLPSK